MSRYGWWAMALCAACAGSAGTAGPAPTPSPSVAGSPPPAEAPMATPLTHARQVAAADGQVATVVGTYQKKMTLKGMPRPGRPPEMVWLGAVELRLEGAASELDNTAPDDEPATLDLGDGPRPEAEVAAWDRKRVKVRGPVVLRPPPDPTVAGPRPAPRITPFDPIQSAD